MRFVRFVKRYVPRSVHVPLDVQRSVLQIEVVSSSLQTMTAVTFDPVFQAHVDRLVVDAYVVPAGYHSVHQIHGDLEGLRGIIK